MGEEEGINLIQAWVKLAQAMNGVSDAIREFNALVAELGEEFIDAIDKVEHIAIRLEDLRDLPRAENVQALKDAMVDLTKTVEKFRNSWVTREFKKE